MRIAVFLACLAFSAACATTPIPPAAPKNPELADELLSETGTAAIDLYVDMDWYFSKSEERSKATLAIGDTKAAIELDRIGASSRVLCRWPKLRLRFGESPKKRLYLSTHCNDTDASAEGSLQSETQLYGQALAHRLIDVLDLPALDTRLVTIRWIDSGDPTKVLIRPAILVEDAADVARAIAGDEKAFQGPGKEGPVDSLDPFDPLQVARAHLFEMMINNRDWRAFRLRPLGRWFLTEQASLLHNFFAITPPGSPPVLIPQDLDASTFAAIPRTVAEITGGADEVLVDLLASKKYLPDESQFIRWLVIRLQSFRRSHPTRVVRQAVESFVKKKDLLYAEIDAFAEVTPAPMREALIARSRTHLDAFFRAIEPPLWDLPVVGVSTAVLFAQSTGEQTVCTDVPIGTPVMLGKRENGRVAIEFAVRVVIDDGKPKRTLCAGPNEVPLSGWIDERAIARGAMEP